MQNPIRKSGFRRETEILKNDSSTYRRFERTNLNGAWL